MPVAKFKQSPLSEVVCGVEFIAPEFSTTHFGLYWQAVRERFPSLPLDRPPIGEIDLLPILPKLRRIWLESADKQQLIQLQSNRFHYNWRRQSITEEYPHFEEIYPKFEQEWQFFQEWWSEIGQSPLQSICYELTYLNQIDSLFGWNRPDDIYKIFTFFSEEQSEFLSHPGSCDIQFKFALPDKLGSLVVSLNQKLKPEENSSVIFFELTCRSIDISYEFSNWFELAHEYTVRAFLDLIRENTKQEWGLEWLAQ